MNYRDDDTFSVINGFPLLLVPLQRGVTVVQSYQVSRNIRSKSDGNPPIKNRESCFPSIIFFNLFCWRRQKSAHNK